MMENIETIKSDLATFADPSTEVLISSDGAMWRQNRRERSVTFTHDEGSDFPLIQYEGKSYSYREFFASEAMADIRQLAHAIVDATPDEPHYIESSAISASINGGRKMMATPVLVEALCSESRSPWKTRVLFVRAQAGGGKTVSLRRLASSKAKGYLSGAASVVYLYVDAQNRALYRLHEAFAAQLQDLRARFTYHAISALTRLGLIVPIIDGFDELLGVGGYKEAFSSLARFLASLHGQGVLVASARSSFYDHSEFHAVAENLWPGLAEDTDFEIVPVEIQPWSLEEQGEYFVRRGASRCVTPPPQSPADLARRIGEQLPSSERGLLGSPFFANGVATFCLGGGVLSHDKRLMPILVRAFVDREVGKLRNSADVPILTSEQHMEMLESLAEEMWRLGRRTLDEGTVKVIAELTCDQYSIVGSDRAALMARIPSYAFFESAREMGGSGVGFTHEYYYAFFLGRRIGRSAPTLGLLNDLLARNSLSDVIAREVACFIREGQAPSAMSVAIRVLGQCASMDGQSAVTKQNCGSICAAAVRVFGEELRGSEFVGVVMQASDLRGTRVSGLVFTKCSLIGVDWREVQWGEVIFRETQLSGVVLGEDSTKVVGALDDWDRVSGVVVAKGEERDEIYSPLRVRQILRKVGLVVAKADTEPTVVEVTEASRERRAMHRILRLFRRSFNVTKDDLENAHLLRDELPTKALKLLEKHGLARTLCIQKRGASPWVWRLIIPPDEVLRAEGDPLGDPRAKAMWAEIA